MSGNGFISPSLSFHLLDRYFYTLNPALDKGQDPGKKKTGKHRKMWPPNASH